MNTQQLLNIFELFCTNDFECFDNGFVLLFLLTCTFSYKKKQNYLVLLVLVSFITFSC